MNAPLKIFSSRDWLFKSSNPVPLLFPWWGKTELPESDPDHGRYNAYTEKGKDCFEFSSSLQESEIAVYPNELNTSEDGLAHLRDLAQQARQSGKKLLVFFNSDDDRDFPIENIVLFRTSFYKSKQAKNTFALPGWSLDFASYFDGQQVVPFSEAGAPVVSYCGYVDYMQAGLKQSVKNILRAPQTHEERAKALRGKACRVLTKSREVRTNFIIRNGFWAAGENDKKKARLEYARNFMDAGYALVARGGGNFSYRLYEVLSCGRIPLFINTDSVLPYDTIIDWKKHAVWVEEKEVDKIDKILLNFHHSKTVTQLEELQRSNRSLYETHIGPLGFFQQLGPFLKSKGL